MSTEFKQISAHSMNGRNDIPFSKEEYSRFKYGSKSVSRKFGKELGEKVALEIIPNLSEKDQVIITPSPYMFIPTAAFALKNYVIAAMNPILISKGMKPLQETKVFRQTGYTAEYGAMSADERKRIIGSETFHVDKDFLRDKIVLFLDDIKITGSHQERMEEMINRLHLTEYAKEICFLYYAVLSDPESDPTIEDHLNLFSIKSLLDLDKIIKNDEFIFNTRNVKYILNAPHIDCVNFLEYQSELFRHNLYHQAIGNSYHLEKKFSMNFNYLDYLVNS